MLIRRAEIEGERLADLRVEHGRITALGEALAARPGEPVIEAAGGALFPGLHDHHFHMAAYAASLDSVSCGPPEIETAEALSARLAALDPVSCDWLRGTGYHESVAGLIDRAFLDRVLPTRPARIQHRSGRLWIFNTAGLAQLDPQTGDPLERESGGLTGRLYDADAWLRGTLAGRFPDLGRASRMLAQWGVTGLTDTTASNGPAELAHFRVAQEGGTLLQSVYLMGDDRLHGMGGVGPRKFHLHDADLPDLDETVDAIARSHTAGRAAAFHCVTRTDLTFALAALDAAGAHPGDRIEHASVTPPELVQLMRRLGVTVVTQPNFIFERGDAYLAELPAEDRAWLYPAASLGLPVAGGTDAPFGAADPWALMDAAVNRATRAGAIIGPDERLSPEAALGLFLGRPEDPGGSKRRVSPGEAADLMLLDRPWRAARQDLRAVRVKATLRAGGLIFSA